MPKAFIRVRQLSQTPIGNFIGGKFNMAIKLTPGSIPLIANFTDSNPPVCNHVYRFDMQTAEKAVFEVTLMESNVFSKVDIARVTLPLNWFPKDCVVTQWFPLKSIKQGTCDLLVLLEVHICYEVMVSLSLIITSLFTIITLSHYHLNRKSETDPNARLKILEK